MTSWIAAAAAAGALVLPGLGLELALVRRSPGPLVRGVRAFLASLAWWSVAIFATRYTPLGLAPLAWGSTALGGLAAAALRLQRGGTPAPRGAWLLLAGLGVLAAAALTPLRAWPVAPGSDMAMHSFVARLITEAGRFPASAEPLYPVRDYASFAAGLPAVSAVLASLSGAPPHRTSLVVALLTYPALAGGLFLLARRFASDPAALLAAIVVAAACGPYDVLAWGGNPTVLAFALGFAAVASLAGDVEASLADGGALLPLLAAGCALVHPISALGLAYAASVPAVLWMAGVPRPQRGAIAVRAAVFVALAGALALLPRLAGPRIAASPAELAWAAAWQRDTPHAYRGTWRDFPVTIWRYLWQRLSGWNGAVVGALGVFGALAAPGRWRRLPWVVWVAVASLLVLNSRYWVLPGSPALYPERMAMLLWAPMAALLAAVLDVLARAAARRGRGASLALAGTAALAVAVAVQHAAWRVRVAGQGVLVGPNDLEVISWIADHVPPGSVVANRLGDAGVWIPALAFRPVLAPHGNPLYFDLMEAWAARQAPRYLFLGERRVFSAPSPFGDEAVRSAPDRFVPLRVRGGARLYEIRAPAAAGARLGP